jgi:sugar fermentation stimulation protein A
VRFSAPLVTGTLLRRYQRFLADVRLDSGETVVAHCPNTGSMLGLKAPGNRVWLSPAANPARKLAWTWEMGTADENPQVRVGIHTGRANGLVGEALDAGLIDELAGFTQRRAEARLGARSRTDWLLDFPDGQAYVEVKSVTAAVQAGVGRFPDAVSERASKHMAELAHVVRTGGRAAVVFCVQRADVTAVGPADTIDPNFGAALRQAARHGVELYALGADLSDTEICLVRRLPVLLE